MTAVEKKLRQEIEHQGVISFARFMELALYTPSLGYYERADCPIGRGGDFYTNVSTGRFYGELLAFQFAEWLAALASQPVQLVEAGAHDGQLSADVLTWLGRNRPALLDQLEYWILEPSRHRQACQAQRLEHFATRIHWFETPAALPRQGINGIVFSNELLDALPVHRLGWDARCQDWFEWGVKLDQDNLVWERIPSGTSPALAAEIASAGLNLPPEIRAVLPDAFTTEISPAAAAWWTDMAARLGRGKLLTIDYGLTREEFLVPERASGTLRAYYRHHLSADLLARPGAQDLTAHLNFTRLQQAGESQGLRTDNLQDQARFLTGIVARLWQSTSAQPDWTPERARQFKTLTHPDHLGRAFRVLIQSRTGACSS